jgi:hypothetical protein
MYSILTDLVCVALVFALAAMLFALSVAVVMTIEGLKLLRERSSAAVAIIGRSLAPVVSAMRGSEVRCRMMNECIGTPSASHL